MSDAEEQAREHLDLADLFLCLSRAFMPPPRGLPFGAWREPLAEDLAALGAALGLETAPVEAALVGLEGTFEDSDGIGWLVEYARLFLTPPVRVPLNTGLYLEGSLAGNSAQMMRACYERGGLEPSAGFRDLPDHVSMQLEFVGRLHEKAAQGDDQAADLADEFCVNFICSWTPSLERACGEVSGTLRAARVFAALAGLAGAAAERRQTPV